MDRHEVAERGGDIANLIKFRNAVFQLFRNTFPQQESRDAMRYKNKRIRNIYTYIYKIYLHRKHYITSICNGDIKTNICLYNTFYIILLIPILNLLIYLKTRIIIGSPAH